jgi:hypothetical protein
MTSKDRADEWFMEFLSYLSPAARREIESDARHRRALRVAFESHANEVIERSACHHRALEG